MGIKNMLQTQGSPYAAEKNGGNIPTNILATKQSPLHYNPTTQKPGYSVDGTNQSVVNAEFIKYNDGMPNTLPPSTQLELGDPTAPTKYDSTPGKRYSDNLPN